MIDFPLYTFIVLLGMLVAELIVGRSTGTISSLSNYPYQRLPSIFIGIGKSKIEYVYHIHHWTWSIVVGSILFLLEFYEVALFFLGIALQGLTYKDRFMIAVDLNNDKY